jgi:hypothetical protein
MAFSKNNLFRQLDQRKRIDWALELKNGREAYEFLVGAVKQDLLNVHQTRNALIALFRIRGHGTATDVLQVFVESARHINKDIRSEAVQLAIGLVRFSRLTDKEPLDFSDEQAKILRNAIDEGLTPKVKALARDFFGVR